jgi:predicted DNA-binding transcriptional regulator AlpA
MNGGSPADELLRPQEVAEWLRNTQSTLGTWRQEHRGPAFIRIGGRVLYRRDAVAEWLTQQEQRSA